MTGETDLDEILASLEVTRRPGSFTFISTREPVTRIPGMEALVHEGEGMTVVVSHEAAVAHHWPVDHEFAWLTLDVHSSLHLVGLTAVVGEALAAEDIACNVIAGFYHDHLLVPVERADDAIAALEALRRPGQD